MQKVNSNAKYNQELAKVFCLGNDFLRKVYGVNTCFPKVTQRMIILIANRGIKMYNRRFLKHDLQCEKNTITEGKKKANDLYPGLIRTYKGAPEIIAKADNRRFFVWKEHFVNINYDLMYNLVCQIADRVSKTDIQSLRPGQKNTAQSFMLAFARFIERYGKDGLFTQIKAPNLAELSAAELSLWEAYKKEVDLQSAREKSAEIQKLSKVRFDQKYIFGLQKTLLKRWEKIHKVCDKDSTLNVHAETEKMLLEHIASIIDARIKDLRLSGNSYHRAKIADKLVNDYYKAFKSNKLRADIYSFVRWACDIERAQFLPKSA